MLPRLLQAVLKKRFVSDNRHLLPAFSVPRSENVSMKRSELEHLIRAARSWSRSSSGSNQDLGRAWMPYSNQSKPLVIIESKRLWGGLQYAREQAMGYAQLYPTCKQLIVSDGIRYRLFQWEKNDEWRDVADMNLLVPKLTQRFQKRPC